MRLCILLSCGALLLLDSVALAQVPATAPAVPPLEEARVLLTDNNPQEALDLLAPLAVPASPDRKQAEAARLLQASCYTALGDTEKALVILRELTSGKGDWGEVAVGTRLGAWRGIADIYLAQGDTLAAEAALKEVVALFPQAEEARLREAAAGSPSAAKILQYNLNRLALDASPGNAVSAAQRLAALHVKAGDYGAAALACRRACLTYPEVAGHRRYALQVAEYLRAQAVRTPQDEAGKRRAQEAHGRAISWYLETLDTGEDRCFSATALLGENQAYLNEVAKPPDRTVIHAALAGLNDSLSRLPNGKPLSPADLAAFEEGWYAALSSTFTPDNASGEAAWRALLDAQCSAPWVQLCTAALAQGLLREGRYEQAAKLVMQSPRSRFPQVQDRLVYLHARAQLGLHRFREAQALLNSIEHRGDDTYLLLSGRILRDLAECAEMQTDWARAEEMYKRAAQESPGDWERKCAEYSLKRIATLRTSPPALDRVRVLPDDRTTRGDWPKAYGKVRYILCAQNFFLDRVGGPGPKLAYKFSTTDPGEPGRLWVTKKVDDDPAALWNPFDKQRRSANRDDYGEQTPLGHGPDLLLRLDLPEGQHRVSLYFVNDHNYYEPLRRYTISVTDASGTLVALTTVDSFGGGVYKRFLVHGGQTLIFRIWRNMSLNTLISGVFLDRG